MNSTNPELNRYVKLLKQSCQIERVETNHETTLDRGMWVFIGILIGLALAWVGR
mgnify:FL=1